MLGSDTDARRSLSEPILQSLARHFDASPEVVRQGVEAALPTAMYAIAARGSTIAGARWLVNGLAGAAIPTRDLDALLRHLAAEEPSERKLLSEEALVRELFLDRLDAVLVELEHITDLDPDRVIELLSLTTTLAMGIVGERARALELAADRVSRFLSAERPSVSTRVPVSLRSALGLDGRRATTSRGTGRASAPPPPRVWPWMLGVAAAVTLVLALPRLNVPSTANMNPPEPLVDPATAPAAPTSPSVAPRYPSSLHRFAAALEDDSPLPVRWTLDEIAFAPGQATLPPKASAVVDELATLLVAHPAATIRLEGSGDEGFGSQRGLAVRRAQALRGALVRKGIRPERIIATATTRVPSERQVDLVLVTRQAPR